MHYLLQRIKCALYGHEYIKRWRDGNYHLECLLCLHRTPGITERLGASKRTQG
jgi:hypothetical protein